MLNILDFFKQQSKYIILENKIDNIKKDSNIKEGFVKNICGICQKLVASQYSLHDSNPVVFVSPTLYEATKAFDVFADLLGTDLVSFFPVENFIKSEMIASSQAFRLARMLTFFSLINHTTKVIVTNASGAVYPVMSLEKIKKSIKEYSVNDVISISTIVSDLTSRGYKKMDITESPGCFSVRGGVVDIYPINSSDPVRLSFFDDEIETIKIIDLETQLSKKHIDKVLILPLYDIFFEESEMGNILNKIKNIYPDSLKTSKDIEKIKNYESLDQMGVYLPEIDENSQSFLSLVKESTVFIEDLYRCEEQINKESREMDEYYLTDNITYPKKLHAQLINKDVFRYIYFSMNSGRLVDKKLSFIMDFESVSSFEYNNQMKTFVNDIAQDKKSTFLVTHFDDKKLSFIEEVFQSNGIEYNKIESFNDVLVSKVNIAVVPNAYGYHDLSKNLIVLTPNEYAPGKIGKYSKFQKYYLQSSKVYNKDDLAPGDYVVHQNYGIGLYKGIVTKEVRGVLNDYLSLEYANDGKLFIPVENIYILEKYLGSKDTKPKLNNINGKEWEKKKARVKAKVKDIAKKLIDVQAKRETEQGFVCEKDSNEQMMFESDFPFIETPDQQKAIEQVKSDMEGTKPMDRLICGDVGFGKTEVALRAAFKEVDNGRQVLYLAPTTVLTRQHYYTFLDRCDKYGVKVCLLNRFTSPNETKYILKGLMDGYVDIVIGTHRLLSNDIKCKNLGLLIVDEEQRFGVEHKEKIKQMKANIDVLTLTATPIPRTLQMSLSGLRDLSLIETAPMNRQPVQTYVLENNDYVIKDAIEKELARNGQVFYLLNRISELDGITRKIKKLVPFAKVGIIHGRMQKEEIEDELSHFLEGDYDVLVCTTIIETGIDIPNANTLIIERADLLGLSQLYQIRGRVGRSDRISYAYLMYDENRIISVDAIKRLEAIKEFTALGSGYKIAMRDLAIRGAGDILGSEQAGFIDDVGMELYMKMLNEAISEEKGQFSFNVPEKRYNVTTAHHINRDYVGADTIRIEVHSKINEIKSREQLNTLKAEFKDRYGELPEDVVLYMETKYFESLMRKVDVENLIETKYDATINFTPEVTATIPAGKLYQLSLKVAPKVKLSYNKDRIYICFNYKDFNNSYIYTATLFLERIIDLIANN